MIRRSGNALFLSMLVLLGMASAAAAKTPEGVEARVTHVEGTAHRMLNGKEQGQPLKKGDRLVKDRTIRVGEQSRIEIAFPDGTLMRFSERSTILLNEIHFDRKSREKSVSVGLSAGKLWASVKKLVTPGSRVEVRTANAVAGVRGTIYRMNVSEDRSTLVRVYDGSVYVSGIPGAKQQSVPGAPVPVPGPQEVPPPYHEVTREEWQVIVQSFQQITITPDGRPSVPTDFTSQQDADDWVRWNQERDRQMSF